MAARKADLGGGKPLPQKQKTVTPADIRRKADELTALARERLAEKNSEIVTIAAGVVLFLVVASYWFGKRRGARE